MRNRWPVVVCVLAASVLVFACAAEQETASPAVGGGETDTVAVTAAWTEFQARFAAGDLDAMVAMFDGDGLLLPIERATVAGVEAVREFWSTEMAARDLLGTLYETELVEVVSTGDWAYTRASFIATGASPRTGESFRVNGRTLSVWRRQPGGAWKMYRAIANRSGEPPR